MKIFSDWYSVLDADRNNLVFENRNKEYGAYVIRREHHRDVLRAFFYAIAGISLIVCIPVLVNLLSRETSVASADEYKEPYVITEYIPPVKQEQKSVAQQPATHATTQSTIPEVTPDEQITATPATNDQLLTDQIGTITTSGEAGISELPGTPVEMPVENNTPVGIAEVMPEFPGGMNKLIEYVQRKLKYPRFAAENSITGIVGISWVIDREGNVTDVEIVRSVHPMLDAEAIRVIQSLPKWTPGKQNGKPVSVFFNMPIRFNLQ